MILYPEKKLAQLVLQTCLVNQITDVVISPGSRNAPLIIGFVNHPDFETYQIVDERSAGFFALGIAQQKQKPVALLCTSGSALLNYYPAIAEAFYSHIPLVILSTDRPAKMIDIGDGQTIRQENVFHNHILFSANLKEFEGLDETTYEKENKRLLKKALDLVIQQSGPVHINIPFDEPLYKLTEKLIDFDLASSLPISNDPLQGETPLKVEELQVFANIWNKADRKLVLIGSSFPDELIQKQIDHLIKDPSVLIMTETISNLHHEKLICSIDQLITPLNEMEFEKLRPEILLTFGGMVVSKRIKQFIREFKPEYHWHIDKWNAPNTYFCLDHHFKVTPQLFFSQFFFLTKQKTSTYQKTWLDVKSKRLQKHQNYMDLVPYSDLSVFDTLLDSLPINSHLQLANSSVVRYAQLFQLNETVRVYCNRGTSGIDGSTSTAVGAATVYKGQTVFITGDISFFYDSNALWNNYVPNSFRIVLINNGGGGIFRILPGPKNTKALSFFETPHQLTAEQLCKMHGMEYLVAKNKVDLNKVLTSFFDQSAKPKLLEVFTPTEHNDQVLTKYFEQL
ncbi:2-succinyl-5-enolpyruvyl-6-hydroxy-3-cyclohexene-1-carboxylic-acid synthase [Namhaeicola litoreus]|uniref:2-succinyl-5-enolpyruvyl-6-hydroxy-3-cyclohexene-1-carboxylate synthase n=1 Tax=Namhaeicola litoreus TaxID=1052145 RepID=A0ABW3Y1Y7_9FLAO